MSPRFNPPALVGSLATSCASLLVPSNGVAAALHEPAADLSSALGLGLALTGTAALLAFTAFPAIRQAVIPPVVESRLSDVLQFDAVLPDGRTIRCKDGSLTRTVRLGGLDYAALTEDERRALFAKRHSFFKSVCEAGERIKILTIRERVSIESDADYDNPILAEIHRRSMDAFEAVYVNRHYVCLTAPAGERGGLKALDERTTRLVETLHDFKPEVLDNGKGDHSPLLSFWSRLVNGWPSSIPCVADNLSDRIVSVHHQSAGRPASSSIRTARAGALPTRFR